MALTWVDGLLWTLCVLSVALGGLRGVVYELLSLVGLFVAVWAAWRFGPTTAQWMQSAGWTQGSAGPWVSWALRPLSLCVTFVLSWMLWALLSHALRLLMKSSPLRGVDRSLGAVFGLLRGALLMGLCVGGVSLTAWWRLPAWQGSPTAQAVYTWWPI